jgi:hypothetical protein
VANVKDDDTLLLVGWAGMSAAAAAQVHLGFTAGGVNTTLEAPLDIETASKLKTLTVVEFYSVAADADSLAVTLTWRTTASTITADHRGLFVVRFRPTGL